MTPTSPPRRRPRPLGLALGLLLAATAPRGALAQEPASVERAVRLKQSTALKAQAETLRAEHNGDDALAAAGKALAIDRDLFGAGSPQTVDALALLARLHERLGHWDAAARARDEVLAIRLTQSGPDHWQTADARRAVAFTSLLRKLGPEQLRALRAADDRDDEVDRLIAGQKLEEAATRKGEVVARRQSVLGATHWQVADALHGLGRLHFMNQKWDAMRRVNEEALAIRRQTLGETHPDTGGSWFNLGQALAQLGESKRALEALRHAVTIWRGSLGDGDTLTDMGMARLAGYLYTQNDPAGAKDGYTTLLAIRRKALPADHPDIAESLYNLGVVQSDLRDLAAARKSHEEALAIRRKILGETHPDTGRSWFNLGQALAGLGESKRAREALRNAVTIWRGSVGDGDALTDIGMERLAGFLYSQKDLAGAKDVLTTLLAIRRRALPENHPKIAESLNNLGVVQSDLRDLAAARTSHEAALAIRRKALPAGHLNIAVSLNNLGLVQSELLEYTAARTSHEEALAIRRKALPAGHPDIADSLYNLGVVQRNLRDFAAARTSHAETLAIYRKALPADHLAIAASLSNLGAVQRDLRDFAAARTSYEEAMAIRRKILPENHPKIASSLYNLGVVQDDLRECAAARTSHEEALTIYRKALPADHPDIADSLNNLGVVQWNLRDFAAARTSLEEALAIRRKALPADHLDIADSLNNLGNVLWNLRDPAAARTSHEEALAIYRKALPAGHPDIAASLNNLGNVQRDLLEYAAARTSHEEALAIRRKALPADHPDIAASLTNLGVVQNDLRDFAAARTSHEEALAIHRKALPADHPDMARSLNNLGVVQSDLRDFAAARTSFEEALAIYRKALPADHPDMARSLNNLGIVQRDLRDFAAARTSHEEALAIRRKTLPAGHPEIAHSLFHLARLGLESGGDLPGTVALLTEATDLLLADQVRLSVAQAEKEQLATAATAESSLHHLLSATLTAGGDAGSAYSRVVRVKGSVTTQQSWVRQARDAADPDTARLLARFREITKALAGQAVAGPIAEQPGGPRDGAAEVRRLADERATLERQLGERSEAFRSIRTRARVGADEVRAALPGGVALVDVVDYLHVEVCAPEQGGLLSEQRMVAFVVRPEARDVVVVPLGPSQALAGLIDRWRTSSGAGKSPPAGAADPGAELRKRLWEPLARHLDGARVVLVSPDGPLHGLPWGALPGSKAGTFLVHDRAFAVVPVPQLLPELMRASPRPAGEPPSLLLAGGIAFGEGKAREVTARDAKLPPVPVFGALAGTESEVNDLRSQFVDAFPGAAVPQVLRKDKATKQAVLSALPSHRFVHLATHGFFAAESETSAVDLAQRAEHLLGGMRLSEEAVGRHPGLLSGVVFAGVNLPERRPEETILTALEAGEQDLERVELVVLSACETGRGQVADGEGVLGLQRAFQVAGARSVVASLWRVSDEETHQLMREFYRRVWSEKPTSKAEALRQAQLWMLENWKPRGPLARPSAVTAPPPYVWAAFVLSGDWR